MEWTLFYQTSKRNNSMYAWNNLTLAKNFNSESLMQDVLKSGWNFLRKHSSFSPDNEFTTIHKQRVTHYCSKRVEYFSLLLIMKHRWSLWKVRLSAAVRFLCLVVWYSTRGQAFHLAIRRCSTPKNAPFRRNSLMNFT